MAECAARPRAVALLGLPDDVGVRLNNGRPGAAEGPRAFRAALATYGVDEPADFEWPTVFDAGDVVPAPGVHAEGLHETHRRVTEAALALHRAGFFPIAIGGGHDLTFPFVRAAVEHWKKPGESFAGLYFDAHLDVRPTVGSGMPFRRLVEDCGVGPLTVTGLNPFANSREHVEWFTAHGGTIDNARHGLTIPTGHHLFFSLDLDVIDASQAPGVSAMNVAGIHAAAAAHAIQMCAGLPVARCLDIMELSPPNDDKNRTARLAAHLFLCAVRGRAAAR